ncbi:MAG TPA: DUF1552 domain-containing protein [Polyangia bacterium]|nr:DUF1552 domain-containing protein [Polyangia bacterium]
MGSKNWTRRQLLKGAGVALSLPWLETFSPPAAKAAAAAAPRRYISLYFPNGSPDFWHPTGAGTSWTPSPILEPLTPNKSRVLVLGNVGNYSPWGAHIEPSHGHNCATAWTGVKASGPGNANGSISIDQAIADQMVAANGGTLPTVLHSLQVGLSTLDASTDGLPGPHSRSISWKSATEPLYKIVSPQGVFDRMLGGGTTGTTPGSTTPDPLAQRRRALKKSALDYIHENATGLQKTLSTSDRARMDKFLTSVRTLEQRVAAPSMPPANPQACTGLARPSQTFGVGNVPADYNRGAHATLMIDLVVMAIQCDVTRVVSFMLDDARSEFVYSFISERNFTPTGSTPGTAPVQNYHGLQHAGPTNNGFATITWWNAQRANELATKLAAITEGGAGNVLDNSVITFMSGMHGGNHDGLDLPIALIGGGGGVLKTNQYMNFGSPGKNLQDMHLTILQKVFGSPLKTFGVPVGGYTSGIIPEILA